MSRTVEDSSTSNPKQLLVELHARLKQAQIRARACDRRWKQLVQQCERAEVRTFVVKKITNLFIYIFIYFNIFFL